MKIFKRLKCVSKLRVHPRMKNYIRRDISELIERVSLSVERNELSSFLTQRSEPRRFTSYTNQAPYPLVVNFQTYDAYLSHPIRPSERCHR